MLILGYAIIQLPGFCRSCYLAIRKFLSKREETKNKNRIEVEEIHQKQTNAKIGKLVGKTENMNLENYIKLKIQVIRNLQEFATSDDAKVVKKSEMWETFMQKEIDFLTQLLENQ